MIGGSDLGFGITVILNNDVSNAANVIRQDFNSMTGAIETGTEKVAKNINLWNNLKFALDGVQSVITQFESVGASYDSSMAELSAVTGLAGKDLESLGTKARQMAQEFGGEASANVDGFTRILSDLGPDIANTPEALNMMASTVQTLAKTMKGDVVGATNALDGAMLQFGVDLSNPIEAAKEMTKYANIMAAGAKAGNVEVTDVAGSVKVSGLVAHNAGLSFEEMNAALQVFGTGMLKSGEAGTGFRNILLKMQTIDALPKDAIKQLQMYGVNMELVKDTTIPFGERLQELSKIAGDTTALTKVFGAENVTAASKLLQSIPAYEDMKKKITGTNTAHEMAATIMGSYEEKMGRIKAQMQDYAITVFNATKSSLPFIQTGIMIATNLTAMAPAFTLVQAGMTKMGITSTIAAFQAGGFTAGMSALTTSLWAGATAAWAFLAPMLPWIALGAAVIAIFVYWDEIVYYTIEAWNYLGEVFTQVTEYISQSLSSTWSDITGFFVGIWDSIVNFISSIGSIGVSIITSINNTILGVFTGFVNFFVGLFEAFASGGLSGVVDYFISFGSSVVEGIMSGIMNAWETLKQMLFGLISSLPGGEIIMSTLGIGGSSGAVQPSQNAFQGLQPQAIGETVAETKGIQSESQKPTIFDKSTTTTENITLNVELDGEVITKNVNSRNDLSKARKG